MASGARSLRGQPQKMMSATTCGASGAEGQGTLHTAILEPALPNDQRLALRRDHTMVISRRRSGAKMAFGIMA
jgi:hypothetical protein